jgi:hypothetical protein
MLWVAHVIDGFAELSFDPLFHLYRGVACGFASSKDSANLLRTHF